MNNIMLDLEFMGDGPDAAITAIGAVKFDLSGMACVDDSFYLPVDLASSVALGMKIDASTVLWWMKQGPEARNLYHQDAVNLGVALSRFSNWVGKDALVWGNGAGIDNVVLSTAYRLNLLKRPWDVRADRCYRTVKSMFPDIEINIQGVHHNALADARNQAAHLIEIATSTEGLTNVSFL